MQNYRCRMLVVLLTSGMIAGGSIAGTANTMSEHERRMREAGFTPENCTMKGYFMVGEAKAARIEPLPKSIFSNVWEFDDGTLCSIVQSNGLFGLRVEGGALKFATADTNASFAWGNVDLTRPPLPMGGKALGENLTHVQVRLHQSLSNSQWRAVLMQDRKPIYSYGPVPLAGTNWQTMTLAFPVGMAAGIYGPYSGLGLRTLTAGNTVEIDWVRPGRSEWMMCYRKTLDLPAAVRWARVSIAVAGPLRFYVNGTRLETYPKHSDRNYDDHLRNYELDPKLFRQGRNVIAAEQEKPCGHSWGILIDGALLCEDGSFQRFDADGSWTFRALDKTEPDYGAFMKPEYNESGWFKTVVSGTVYDFISKQQNWKTFFNPSYKGMIMAAPADGRDQPVFGCREDVALKVAVPRKTGRTNEVLWQIFDEMGDGFHAGDRLVREGHLKLETGNLKLEKRDEVGTLTFPAGTLASNVAYAVVLRLKTNGQEVETRRYEIAVCGPVHQPVVANPTNYTDGMDLKLVWEMDAAGEPKPGATQEAGFISCDANAKPRASTVIATPLGKFRQPYLDPKDWQGSWCAYLSYRYTIRRPGRPHVAIAEYPDDTTRDQEMRLVDAPPGGGYGTQIGNHTVKLGWNHPLSHTLRRHTVLFFPNELTGTVSIINNLWGESITPDMAARVGRIRIYEILSEVPARRMNDAPGQPKWIGQQSEGGPRQIVNSCFSSPITAWFHGQWLAAEGPNFYRNWMVAYINLVKRMRFAGDTVIYPGQIQYNGVFWPSVYNSDGQIATGGSLRDYGVLLSKMLEENGLGWFSGIELCNLPDYSPKARYTDEEVAAGADTIGQVDLNGKQCKWYEPPMLNWARPEGRAHFEQAMNEMIALYGKEKGWKGVYLQVNELEGPCWLDPTGSNPYRCSYDDWTIAQFEKDTGVRIPEARSQRSEVSSQKSEAGSQRLARRSSSSEVGAEGSDSTDKKNTPDPKRFTKRYDWLMANAEAKVKWTDWRCRKMNEIYDWLADRLIQTRPDLRLVFYPQAVSYTIPPPYEPASNALHSIYDYARRGGMDLEYIKNRPGIILAMNVQAVFGKRTEDPAARYMARTEKYLTPFADDGKSGVSVRYNWFETDIPGPKDWLWQLSEMESWPFSRDEYGRDFHVNAFLRTNPALLAMPLTDLAMWMGRELEFSYFAKAFRSLPVARYTRLSGEGRDSNIWIAVAQYGRDAYGYVANPQWWELDAVVSLSPSAGVQDLMEERPLAGERWRLRLRPYDIRTFHASRARADDVVRACLVTTPAAASAAIRELTARAHAVLDALRNNTLDVAADIRAAPIQEMLEQARRQEDAGDFSGAYETLTMAEGASEMAKANLVYSATVWRKKADQLLVQGKADQAYEIYSKVLGMKDATPEDIGWALTFTLDRRVAAAGGTPEERHERMIGEFQKILALPGLPPNIAANAYRAMVNRCLVKGQNQRARDLYDLFAQLPGATNDWTFGLTGLDLSQTYLADKSFDRAMALAKQALVMPGMPAPYTAVALTVAGRAYQGLSEPTKAQEAFAQICERYAATAYAATLDFAVTQLDPAAIGRERYRAALRAIAKDTPDTPANSALLTKVKTMIEANP